MAIHTHLHSTSEAHVKITDRDCRRPSSRVGSNAPLPRPKTRPPVARTAPLCNSPHTQCSRLQLQIGSLTGGAAAPYGITA